MGLASCLAALGDGTLPESFEGLKSRLPVAWIGSSLANSGIATLRKRKLPSEQVIWLLIGMGLYRDRPIVELVDRLDLVLPGPAGEKRFIAKSAITPARDRVGAQPLQELFQTTAVHWALASSERLAWRGLKVLGMDGTTLRVPDSSENRHEFELFARSSYPVVRIITLMALRSRLILECSFSGCRTSELALAYKVISAIPDKSVTVFDRYFYNYKLWNTITGSGVERHWVVRARNDLQNWKVIKCLGKGDELVEIRPSRSSRSNNPELPEVIVARVIRSRRAGYKTRTLITSLTDAEKYPAAEIAGLYQERWEQELGYRELKAETLEGHEAIRSQSPERIRQEIWGLLIAYNLVRQEMESAAQELKVSPLRISFRVTLALMRDFFFWAEVASPGKLPKMFRKMRLDLRQIVLPERRSRSYPRHVKTPQRKYGSNVTHPSARKPQPKAASNGSAPRGAGVFASRKLSKILK